MIIHPFQKTQEQWRDVFYVCGGFCLLGGVVFGCFARTDLEPWARDPETLDANKMEIEVADVSLNFNKEKLEGSFPVKRNDSEEATAPIDDVIKAYDNEGYKVE